VKRLSREGSIQIKNIRRNDMPLLTAMDASVLHSFNKRFGSGLHDTNGEEYTMKKKTMAGRGEVGQLVVTLFEDAGEFFYAEFSAPDLHHGADETAHHSPQKPVCPDTINKALFVLFPGAFQDGAEEGLYLAVAFSESGKILVSGDEGGGSPELVAVEGIGIEPGAVGEEGVLDPIDIVPVLPAGGVEPAVGVGGYGVDIVQDDVGGKDGVDIIKNALVDSPFIIKVEEVLKGVDAAVGAGRSGEFEAGAEEGAEGFFDFLLDGGGVLLDLESAVVGAFVGEFEEIPGHGGKDTARAGMRGRRACMGGEATAGWSEPARAVGCGWTERSGQVEAGRWREEGMRGRGWMKKGCGQVEAGRR